MCGFGHQLISLCISNQNVSFLVINKEILARLNKLRMNVYALVSVRYKHCCSRKAGEMCVGGGGWMSRGRQRDGRMEEKSIWRAVDEH